MEKKKVYVVGINQTCKAEVLRESVDVFETEEKAQAHFKAFVEDEKKWIEENAEEWIVSADEEEVFEAYEQGYYAENHTYAYVQEKEVQ